MTENVEQEDSKKRVKEIFGSGKDASRFIIKTNGYVKPISPKNWIEMFSILSQEHIRRTVPKTKNL